MHAQLFSSELLWTEDCHAAYVPLSEQECL